MFFSMDLEVNSRSLCYSTDHEIMSSLISSIYTSQYLDRDKCGGILDSMTISSEDISSILIYLLVINMESFIDLFNLCAKMSLLAKSSKDFEALGPFLFKNGILIGNGEKCLISAIQKGYKGNEEDA